MEAALEKAGGTDIPLVSSQCLRVNYSHRNAPQTLSFHPLSTNLVSQLLHQNRSAPSAPVPLLRRVRGEGSGCPQRSGTSLWVLYLSTGQPSCPPADPWMFLSLILNPRLIFSTQRLPANWLLFLKLLLSLWRSFYLSQSEGLFFPQAQGKTMVPNRALFRPSHQRIA